jgi:hypothetical protein
MNDYSSKYCRMTNKNEFNYLVEVYHYIIVVLHWIDEKRQRRKYNEDTFNQTT